MRIAVIGAGASAVCLLDALAQRWEAPAEISVFEPAPQLWRGRPYRADTPAVKVNAPPSEMTVRDGDARHFADWLERRATAAQLAAAADPWSGDRFVPRSLYGSYLEDSADAAITALARNGIGVELRRSAVTGLLRTVRRVVVRTADGAVEPFDACVLCVGVTKPDDRYGLDGHPDFVSDTYPAVTALAGIDPDHDVAILGSGLTAVDAALALAHSGHRGRIALASRSGVLPGVRQRQVAYEPRHFTAERLRDLARQRAITLEAVAALMDRELGAAGCDTGAVATEFGSMGVESARQRLERHLAEVDAADLGLRIMQQAVPEAGPDIWPALPAADKDLVLNRHYRTLMSLCCPMPPSSAATLLRFMEFGQLEVLGRLTGVRPSRRGFTLAAEGAVRRFDTVVNAMSASRHRIPSAAAPVVNSMLRSGAAQRHPHGGLRIVPSTSQIVSVRGPDARLYALGDLAAGTLFFTFGVPSLVDRARDIVTALDRVGRTAHRPHVPTVTSNL
ncbi:FAD/NAD(P)-binding protein [Glycomyces arizonensis]|uniref:FAD/NAD(P)-binding protein n=1 Tax=Glycomyces arizonensis TaxID=256035 RepID=UPI0003FEEE34|nr:FAD/NAD(P)-binding protein [Glycomyces arizonensis]